MGEDREVTISLKEYAMLLTAHANFMAIKNFIYANIDYSELDRQWELYDLDKIMSAIDAITWEEVVAKLNANKVKCE